MAKGGGPLLVVVFLFLVLAVGISLDNDWAREESRLRNKNLKLERNRDAYPKAYKRQGNLRMNSAEAAMEEESWRRNKRNIKMKERNDKNAKMDLRGEKPWKEGKKAWKNKEKGGVVDRSRNARDTKKNSRDRDRRGTKHNKEKWKASSSGNANKPNPKEEDKKRREKFGRQSNRGKPSDSNEEIKKQNKGGSKSLKKKIIKDAKLDAEKELNVKNKRQRDKGQTKADKEKKRKENIERKLYSKQNKDPNHFEKKEKRKKEKINHPKKPKQDATGNPKGKSPSIKKKKVQARKGKETKKKEKKENEVLIILGATGEGGTGTKTTVKGSCPENYVVNSGESAVFFSYNTRKRSNCLFKFEAPADDTLTLTCPQFSLTNGGCSTEKIVVLDKVSKTKTTHCLDDAPETVSTGNKLHIRHRKRRLKKKEGFCTNGLVCQVSITGSAIPSRLLGSDEDCGQTIEVGIGETVAVFSLNSPSARTCDHSIRSPQGSLLSLTCPNQLFSWKSCSAESLIIRDFGGYRTERICKKKSTRLPVPFEILGHRVSFEYRRDETDFECTRGFFCQVTVVDWWNSAPEIENFEAPGYREGSLLWPFPHTTCPDIASLSTIDTECRNRCVNDDDCPLLTYCCPTGCGRICVPPAVVNQDSCGCSLVFYPENYDNLDDSEHLFAKVTSFMWMSIYDSYTSAMEPHLTDSNSFTRSVIGNVEGLCHFKHLTEKVSLYRKELDLFKKPSRKLFMIKDSSDPPMLEGVSTEAFRNAFTFSCLLLVGNVTVDQIFIEQFISTLPSGDPCLWEVESYNNLPDLVPQIQAVIDDGSCVCQDGTSSRGECLGVGEPCQEYEECDPINICLNGQCHSRSCVVPLEFAADSDYNDYYYYDNYYEYHEYFAENGAQFYHEYDYFYADMSLKEVVGKRTRPIIENKPQRITHRRPVKGHKAHKNPAKKNPKEDNAHNRNHQSSSFVRRDYATAKRNGDGCCSPGELTCNSVPIMCVSPINVCDDVPDCPNGDDETPDVCALRSCSDDKFLECGSGGCISIHWLCDGVQDCLDGSDEFCRNYTDCPPGTQHFCSSGECIRHYQFCNGIPDCKSGEDELSCRCRGFRCDSGECIDSFLLFGSNATFAECDGHFNCVDGSDEYCRPPLNGGCPLHSPFKCQSGECIFSHKVCDGYEDCKDGSDEFCGPPLNGDCPSDRPFKCPDGECIYEDDISDGFEDCIDGSDELGESSPSIDDCFFCGSGLCISFNYRCNGQDDCADGSDEANCQDFSCDDYKFKCASGECLDEDVICNGRQECLDGSDEFSCGPGNCPESRPFQCSSGECLPLNKVCNAVYDCVDRSDESKCSALQCPKNRENKCASGECNLYLDPCDGNSECADGSDEVGCASFQCEKYSFKCSSGECVGNFYVCDSDGDCRDGSDEFDCEDNGDNFLCLSGEIIPASWICDGDRDCHDGSDERNCTNCNEVETRALCSSGECLPLRKICNGYNDCLDGTADENNCESFVCPSDRSFHCGSGECREAFFQCDGYINCRDGSDEKDCHLFDCPPFRNFKCTSTGVCITIYQVCNGYEDCADGSDELDCENHECPESTYQCQFGNCIPLAFQCDRQKDCVNTDDEMNCD